MSAALLIVITAIYFGVALNELRLANGPMALVFGAYAVANLGLIWQLQR